MSNTLLSIRTDEKTKKEVAAFAASVGLSVSAFVTAVLKQAIREGHIVLSPSLEPSAYLEEIIRKAKADLSAGLATPPLNKHESRQHLQSLMKK